MTGHAGRINRYLSAHWNGQQGWFWTAAINLFGLRVILGALPGPPQTPIGAALLAVYLAASLGLLIWQMVGGWRAAERGLRDSGDMYPALVVYTGMLLALALALVQASDRIAGYFALPEDLSTPAAAQLPVSADGRVILARGEITFALNTALKSAIAAHPGAETVLLDSGGGNIFAGRSMAREIAGAGLATRVEGRCFSACTLAFVAGATRSLGSEGRLGFHGYAFDSAMRVQTFDVRKEEARDRDWMAAQGVAAAFLDRVFATPPSELWQPRRGELVAAGVITD